MKVHLLILFFFLSIGVSSHEQVNDEVTTFHKHTQTCHYIGTTEKDYVIELFPDSLIKISEYTSSYRDQYNSVIRTIYSGIYRIYHDTVRIKYLTHNTEVKNKSLSALPASYTKPLNDFVLYPSSIFILKDSQIIPTDYLFETLPVSKHAIANQLKYKFQSWSYTKRNEVFGVSR
jgi:hypothetical protein